MKIVVSTCDKYDYLVPGFAHCFNKYWNIPGQIVDVVGYRDQPLPPNFKMHVLNAADDKPFTYYLHNYVRDMQDDYFIFLFDDYWLIQPPQLDLMALMEQEVQAGAEKGDLSTNTQYFTHDIYKRATATTPELIVARQDAQYRTSTQPCIWRRKHMLNLLDPKGLTPWEFELQPKATKDGSKIVGTHTQIYKYANVVHKGVADYYAIEQIPQDTRQELITIGYENLGEHLLNFNQFKYKNYIDGSVRHQSGSTI